MSDPQKKPAGYEADLSEYKVCFIDSGCGEPIHWGFEVVRRLGEERFHALGEYGELKYGNPGGPPGGPWYLVTKALTRAEAIAKYGPVTHEEFGPRGGYGSVTFGNKKFYSHKQLAEPRPEPPAGRRPGPIGPWPDLPPLPPDLPPKKRRKSKDTR